MLEKGTVEHNLECGDILDGETLLAMKDDIAHLREVVPLLSVAYSVYTKAIPSLIMDGQSFANKKAKGIDVEKIAEHEALKLRVMRHHI